MKTNRCQCGNRIFFNNHQCLACGRALGHCNHCHELSSFSETEGGAATCDQTHCGRDVAPCDNRLQGVCTSFVEASVGGICTWCQFTTAIPDLSLPKNVARLGALEVAKRRLLVALEELGLPPFLPNVQEHFPLSFQFLLPLAQPDGSVQTVSTGHADGVITINAEEADSDRREATRVALGEPQRTLIGHMRHEIGHYIDWCYAWQIASEEYTALFGDPFAIDYEEAKKNHYAHGAPANWGDSFVSAYSTMHPWEDFAECVNAYLDMMAIAQTAKDQGLARIDTRPTANFATLVVEVLRLAIAISEFNTDLGLPALLPERLAQPTIRKLEFVHSLRSPARRKDLERILANRADQAEQKTATSEPVIK